MKLYNIIKVKKERKYPYLALMIRIKSAALLLEQTFGRDCPSIVYEYFT